jgi:hypothetical protein
MKRRTPDGSEAGGEVLKIIDRQINHAPSMSLPTIHSSALRYLALTALAVCSFGVSQQVTATEVVPLSLTETVRQAQTIVVGTVVSQQTRWGTDAKRWMLTDYTVAVEEVIATDGRAQPFGDRMIVTYWGGTIGSETHGISDRREPRVGERLLLMLQQDWQTTVTASPAVGFNYGLFVVAAGEGDETAIVRDAHGKPLARSNDGRLAWRTGDAPAGTSDTIDLASFIKWLRERLPSIKASPSEIPPPADPNDPRVLKTYSHAPAFMPAQPRHDERSAFPAGPLQPHLLDRSTQAPQPDYVTFRQGQHSDHCEQLPKHVHAVGAGGPDPDVELELLCRYLSGADESDRDVWMERQCVRSLRLPELGHAAVRLWVRVGTH